MVRSMAEKPTSSGVEASSTTCRSARTDPGLPAEQRADRAHQPVVGGRAQHLAFLHHRRQVARVARIVVGRVGVRHFSPSAPGVPIRIGIGNAELRENLPFETFHGFGVVVVLVVVADQMQEPVDRQMAEVMIERLLFVVGLFARGLIGDGDVAEHARRVVGRGRAGRLQRRKRQHVGRLVDAAPVAVERADAGIVGQHDRELGLADIGIGDFGRGIDGAMDHRLGVRLGLPAIGDDENFGEGKGGRHGRSSALHSSVRVTAADLPAAGPRPTLCWVKICRLPAFAAIPHRRRRSAPPVHGG